MHALNITVVKKSIVPLEISAHPSYDNLHYT